MMNVLITYFVVHVSLKSHLNYYFVVHVSFKSPLNLYEWYLLHPIAFFFHVCLWVFFTIRDLFLQSQNFSQIVNTGIVLGTSIVTLVKTYRGKTLKDLLWTCATATSLAAFEKSMDNLKNMSLGVSQYMKNIGPTHFSHNSSVTYSWITCVNALVAIIWILGLTVLWQLMKW